MEKERISEHESVIKVYERLRKESVVGSKTHDRLFVRLEKEGITNI